ncbi:hypothetical protein [Nesterenkonia muleiensis]|uniref:hypothetical protein n=1 Tax=Nesterenkonia muleiensis TaxID=2282648 RepID=UPI000E736337|nr:hypothetical protein [Nesterenkonia muleiensis]
MTSPPPQHRRVPDLSASADENRDFLDEHSAPDQEAGQRPGYRAAALWALGLVAAVAAAVFAVWQVNEHLYAPEATAQSYWDSLAEGEGSQALGHFSALPDFAEEPQVDHLLLTGDPLTRSAELIESPDITETGDGAQLSFTSAEEEYTTELPLTHSGTTWGFFDNWEISPAGLTWFQVEVPGAPQGGIGQIEINGEPVNLDAETARLSAFVPTVAEISIESQWLTGAVSHVVTAAEDSDAPAELVTMELEASEDATQLLHEELTEYFEECDQQVLMPSGCPVGTSTSHQVDADTIDWTFPEPEAFELSFDAEGWQVSSEDLVAEVSFEARHFHTGEQLTETEDVPFSLDVQVGASGEDLVVSVAGSE